MNKCLHCKEKDCNNKFCSRRCANTYKNLHNHARKGKGEGYPFCQFCKTVRVPSYGHKFCLKCTTLRFLYSKNPSILELKKFYKNAKHSTAVQSYIRSHARLVVLKDVIKKCNICGYDKHVEASHKKSISTFPNSAKLNEINDINNLVFLCPNHHWEFDHGMLDLKQKSCVTAV